MSSFHYMREIQKDNERRIARVNKFKPYYAENVQNPQEKPASPDIFSRLLHGLGNLLVSLGTRLKAVSA